MNKVILLGRLTKDTELLTSSNDKFVGKFRLAVPIKYAKEGEERKTDFINIISFGKLAEFTGKFFKKGQQVLVCGRLEINQYEDEQGEMLYITQIIAEELDFADSKKDKDENTVNYESLYANGNFGDNEDVEEKTEDKTMIFRFREE